MTAIKIVISDQNIPNFNNVMFDNTIKCQCNSPLKNSLNIPKEFAISYCGGDHDQNIHEPKRAEDVPKLIIDGYVLYHFLNELKVSKTYRECLIKKYSKSLKTNCCQSQCKLRISLQPPVKEFLDIVWCEKLCKLCQEQQELDYTMSLLSTLGGAFSALGDHYVNCAEIAGKISLHQFKLALRIGDPLTVARCKLFISLSLLQRQHFKLAKLLILQQYQLAKNSPVRDFRLENMCKGIWEKLRYENKIYKQGNALDKTNNNQIKISSKN